MTSPDSGSGRLTPTDHSLAKRVKNGDQEAAHVLYQRYARRVFGLVDSKLGAKLRTTTDAEDVVQSVFRSMFRGVQTGTYGVCLLYTSPSPRDKRQSRMPSSA